jgi:hypothetical protein
MWKLPDLTRYNFTCKNLRCYSYMFERFVDSQYYDLITARFPKRFGQYMVVGAGYRLVQNNWESYLVLQGTARYCKVLQGTARYCKVLQGTAEDALKEYHAKYPR